MNTDLQVNNDTCKTMVAISINQKRTRKRKSI